jgi:hypothetical protein
MMRRIALVGVAGLGGGATMTSAFYDFLVKSGYDVALFYCNLPPQPERGWLGRFRRQPPVTKEAHLAAIAAQLREQHFDIVLGIENGEIFLEKLPPCRRIYFANAPWAHEEYFSLASTNQPFDLDAIRRLQERELAVFAAVDVLAFAWNTHVTYVRKHLYNGANLIEHPGLGWFGCTPRQKSCGYWYPPSLVFLGWMERYWVNMELLARLSASIPYVLDTYGPQAPRPERNLRYKGVAPNEEVVAGYQFGLTTATSEPLRQWGVASKVLTYLEFGLPSLAPEWQLFSHQLDGVIPYNAQNFPALVEEYSERDKWEAISRRCREQAAALAWDNVLRPLIPLLEGL